MAGGLPRHAHGGVEVGAGAAGDPCDCGATPWAWRGVHGPAGGTVGPPGEGATAAAVGGEDAVVVDTTESPTLFAGFRILSLWLIAGPALCEDSELQVAPKAPPAACVKRRCQKIAVHWKVLTECQCIGGWEVPLVP